MSESQEDIDALLAEVSALAQEAVEEIVGDTPEGGATAQPVAAPTPAPSNIAPRSTAESSASVQRTGDLRTPSGEDASRILMLEVPVIVKLAERTMPFSEIVNMSTGAILEFEQPSDSELDLMINNKCIGRGQAVKVGENFGLRVTTIGSIRARIKALGDQ